MTSKSPGEHFHTDSFPTQKTTPQLDTMQGQKNLKCYFNYSAFKPVPIYLPLSLVTCHYAVVYAWAACFFTDAWAAARRAMGTR